MAPCLRRGAWRSRRPQFCPMTARGTRLEHFLTAHWIIVLAALLVVAYGLLSGCASPGPYRTDKDPQHPIVEHFDTDGYDVGYVEFDEQGWFWMPDNGKDDIGHREQV